MWKSKEICGLEWNSLWRTDSRKIADADIIINIISQYRSFMAHAQ